MYYPACPEAGNNKKLVQQGDGWFCEANGTTYDEPEWRYIFSFNAMDHSGCSWVTAFNDQVCAIDWMSKYGVCTNLIVDCHAFAMQAAQMFGISANELKKLKDEDQVRQRVLFGFMRTERSSSDALCMMCFKIYVVACIRG